ncbi:hypothetical protein HS088_TW18G00613 [Tripterygium wilfordii]|uniref:Uncharacterized protein n=1 Tax=Tripterygium wilfordii TaxID=458696 RepID=A0A7J7CDY1_TRIWF|nr:hypothetical protein HS088_TW18G00613 [Tripterygium wilfordii]
MIFGSLLSFLLPFWSQKLQKIRQIQGETEMVVEEVEKVAEVVEKVAIAAEKLSGDVAENLPDSARLKQAALFLERISEKTAHDAHVTEDFMHKVDAVERDLDALENIVEPLINKFAEKVSVQKDGKSSAAAKVLNRFERAPLIAGPGASDGGNAMADGVVGTGAGEEADGVGGDGGELTLTGDGAGTVGIVVLLGAGADAEDGGVATGDLAGDCVGDCAIVWTSSNSTTMTSIATLFSSITKASEEETAKRTCLFVN